MRRNPDKTWVTPEAGCVQESAGMQSAATYISHRQGAVAQWVELIPIFEVCAREKGYNEGGGGQEVPIV